MLLTIGSEKRLGIECGMGGLDAKSLFGGSSWGCDYTDTE